MLVGDAVNANGVRGDQALGIDQAVKGPPGRQQVVDLDAADLDQTVARLGVEASGFGVENDFAGHAP
ncbi:hypothetical protein D3C87_1392830 [compost metagenome]